jgi:hypothetical protein
LTEVGGIEEVEIIINGRNFRLDILDEKRKTIYEIQRSFGKTFSNKVDMLLEFSEMRIVIVHPIVLSQKVTRMKQTEVIHTSYINKHTDIYSLFDTLVNFNVEFINDRMEINIPFVKEHLLKEFIGTWGKTNRRRYRTIQRDLISVEKTTRLKTRDDFLDLLPKELPNAFTNRELAEILNLTGSTRRVKRIPGRMTYSLCRLGILKRVGIRGRAHEFIII